MVKKYLNAQAEPAYPRSDQPQPQLGPFSALIKQRLVLDAALPKAKRRTARRVFEGLQAEGYAGAYDRVQRHVKAWKAVTSGRDALTQAFVPLSFAPGEVGHFDWSYEHVVLGGVTQTIKLAHFRLVHSRAMFVVAYPRETQAMVRDAHDRAFAVEGGVAQKMIYDNLKTVVDAVFSGKDTPVQTALSGADPS